MGRWISQAFGTAECVQHHDSHLNKQLEGSASQFFTRKSTLPKHQLSLASPSAVTFSGRNPKDMDNIDKKPWQPSTEVLRNWWQFVVAGNQHFAAFIFLNLGLASLKASSFITTQLLLQQSEKWNQKWIFCNDWRGQGECSQELTGHVWLSSLPWLKLIQAHRIFPLFRGSHWQSQYWPMLQNPDSVTQHKIPVYKWIPISVSFAIVHQTN